jgi:hypothetical protein
MKYGVICVVLLFAAACSPKSRDDTALSHDLTLASQVQQPHVTFQDTAISQAPVPAPRAPDRTKAAPHHATAPQPTQNVAPAPAAVVQDSVPTPTPAPIMVAPAIVPIPAAVKEIPIGTSLAITATSKVCMSTNHPGDRLVATVNAPIAGSNGAMIPAGSSVVLEVASVTPATSTDSALIALRVKSIVVNDASYTVSGDVSSLAPLQKVSVAGKSADDRNKVIGGAVAGAILGQILGHNTKGTVIGAAAGAGAGAVVAKADQKYDACLPQGAPLQVTLRQAIPM